MPEERPVTSPKTKGLFSLFLRLSSTVFLNQWSGVHWWSSEHHLVGHPVNHPDHLLLACSLCSYTRGAPTCSVTVWSAGPMIHQLTLFLQWKQTISPVCWFLVRPEKTVIYKTKQKVSASVLHSVWFNLRPQTLWLDVKRWILYLSGRFLLGQALWFDPDANGVCLRSSRAVRDDVHPPPLWFIWHTHFFSPFSFP